MYWLKTREREELGGRLRDRGSERCILLTPFRMTHGNTIKLPYDIGSPHFKFGRPDCHNRERIGFTARMHWLFRHDHVYDMSTELSDDEYDDPPAGVTVPDTWPCYPRDWPAHQVRNTDVRTVGVPQVLAQDVHPV